MLATLFPSERFGKLDYALAVTFLSLCFALFFHGDLQSMGWDSLNYLFGDVLEFYENCKRIHGGGINMLGTPYPPTVYAIFALWLYPLKLLGLITSPEAFPPILTYWLKALTTLVYIGSGWVFYRIALAYSVSKQRARFFTAAWLTTPLAVFPQFLFSQMDIFYVALTLAGFLMFLRRRLYWAATCFGVAITFKYFPLFAFIPLLLLYEKRVARIALCCALTALPTLLIHLLYGESLAFVEGVQNHFALDRVFAASLDLVGWRIYLLFATFVILCGMAYFLEVTEEYLPRTAAFIWLVAAIFPFIFIVWHPQWAITYSPAIVLTSMLSSKPEKFMMLDLVGMFFFVAVLALGLQDNGDAAIFQGALFGLDFANSYPMANLFSWFADHSLYVFLSSFWGYLVLQGVLKYPLLFAPAPSGATEWIDYGFIRQRLYIGALIFALPASFAIYKDLTRNESFTGNKVASAHLGRLLSSRTFEQTFVAKGAAITRVSLLLTTFSRQNMSDLTVEIVDAGGRPLFRVREPVWRYSDNSWREFNVGAVPVTEGARYKIRLTSPNASRRHSIGWFASTTNTYVEGEAIVDGVPRKLDFVFRVSFPR